VHGVPDGAAVVVDAAAEQHHARMDAGAHPEALDAERPRRPFGMLRRRLDDAQPRVHGLRRVVLAQAQRSERGLQAVAREAQHLAAVGAHDAREALQRVAHQRQRILGAHALEHGGGVGHVDEEHAHLPQAGCGAVLHAAAQGAHCRVDGGVAQHGALRLELRDGGLERTRARAPISHVHPQVASTYCCGRPCPA